MTAKATTKKELRPALSAGKPAKEKAVVKYVQAKGGRKTAYAVARVFNQTGGLTVNGKDYKEYFKSLRNQLAAIGSLAIVKLAEKMSATVKVTGGGINAQAEAVRNAVARALASFDSSLRLVLKGAGFLTRDARMVERKKYGLRKARRAPQWAKR